MKSSEEVHFQETVSQFLIRHRSILDVQTKLVEAAARVNRAVAKSVTTCGCISISADRQRFPADVSLREVRELLATHLRGDMCEKCREVVESEIGATLFYLAAMCSLLNLNLRDVLEKEYNRVNALGVFNLT
jgi:activator of 2-hydroxyglutaryl-CoA dehydratase